MKKNVKFGVLLAVMLLICGFTVQAKEEDTIKNGVYAETLDLSGKTAAQATAAIESYVEELKGTTITLLAADDNEVPVTVGELGITWKNRDIVAEAAKLGTEGNVIQRYKLQKDLEHENKIYDLEFSFDQQAINDILVNECAKYDQKAVSASLKRENGAFQIVGGQPGYVLDVAASADKLNDYLANEWNGQDGSIALDIIVDEPKGSAGELEEVKDLLGSFTTSYSSSGSSRRANVENGCRLINGTTVYPGEEFSTYATVSPFSQANGYYMAGSYLNGKVVDSLGGGICQVSTTLYNAVLRSELEVTERHNHSMIVSYVDPSADAAIAESSGKDFKFVNNLDYPIYIEGYTADRKITFNIYGKETRDAGHKVSYVSEVLEVNKPQADAIYADSSHAIGYIASDSAHVGYKAKLWKVVTENGVEVSRTEVNSSSYKMVPRSATVGVATDNPQAYEEIMAAIGTGNLDHVRNVMNALISQPAETPEVGEE
ncbi:MAG: VanW family protein [Lachnospiraceae bacterium]|nr:VanW family protein [Lachnospiraceae bacterium]